MKRIIIMLAGVLLATGAAAQDRILDNYISTLCNRMNDAARLAVAGAQQKVAQSLTYGVIHRVGERLVFDNLPDADDRVKATIKGDWSEYAIVLVDRAYNPHEHSWFSPHSTNLCVWNLDRCVSHAARAYNLIFPSGAEARTAARTRLQNFQGVCKPPEYNQDDEGACAVGFDEPFVGESVDPLLRLSLSCQRKIGGFPN